MAPRERSITEIECDVLMLCDVVRPYENRLHMLGAGWDSILIQNLPAKREIGLAIRLVGPLQLMTVPMQVGIEVVGPIETADEPIRLASAKVDLNPYPEAEDLVKDAAVFLLPARLHTTFRHYGKHHVTLRINNVETRSTHFWILDPASIPSDPAVEPH